MKRQFVLYVVAIATLLVPLSVFGAGAGEEEVEAELNVGVITSIGGLGDLGFNDLAHDAVKRAESELGIKFSIVEPVSEEDIGEFQRELARTGTFDVIVTVGFIHASSLKEVAAEFSDQHWFIIDSVVDLPNVTSIVFREQEGSFLAGVVAGMMTEADVVGFVGGMEVPLIRRFQVGYEEGVAWVNADARVLVTYVGSFDNPTGGKDHALSQYSNDADIIYHAAGGTGLGVLDAAEETDLMAIGVNTSQESLHPGYVVTSMMKRVDEALFDAIAAYMDEGLNAGTVSYGLAEGGVGLSRSDIALSLVPGEVWEKVDQAKEQIIAGELEVTDAMQN